MDRWQRVRSAAFLRGKAVWYRDMARHAAGADRDRMLATAATFDARGQAREHADVAQRDAADALRAAARRTGARAR